MEKVTGPQSITSEISTPNSSSCTDVCRYLYLPEMHPALPWTDPVFSLTQFSTLFHILTCACEHTFHLLEVCFLLPTPLLSSYESQLQILCACVCVCVSVTASLGHFYFLLNFGCFECATLEVK